MRNLWIVDVAGNQCILGGVQFELFTPKCNAPQAYCCSLQRLQYLYSFTKGFWFIHLFVFLLSLCAAAHSPMSNEVIHSYTLLIRIIQDMPLFLRRVKYNSITFTSFKVSLFIQRFSNVERINTGLSMSGICGELNLYKRTGVKFSWAWKVHISTSLYIYISIYLSIYLSIL